MHGGSSTEGAILIMNVEFHHKQFAKEIVLFGVVLISIPFFLSTINSIFLNNVDGDWDNWMYYGYIKHLFRFSDSEIWDANRYIGTRIAYFLPGHLIYAIFGDNYYRLAFNIGLCGTAIILSFYYIARAYMPLRVAVAASVLLATDFYFLRSIGWDYVDKGVLAYEMLTLACLTAARFQRRQYLMIAAAGFFAASMLFVHLASVIVFPLLFIYYGFVVQNARSLRDWLRHFITILVFGTVGAVLAQVVYGTLMVTLHGGDFFFLAAQIGIVQSNISGWNAALPELLAHGYWITVPLAALVGAALSLAAKPFRATTSRFEAFWLWAVFVLFGVLFAGEVTGKLWLLSRDGMHSTILVPFSMLVFGILLYRRPFRGMIALTLAVFGGAFLVRVGIGSGAGLSRYLALPMPVLGILMGLVLATSFVVSDRRVSIAVLVALGELVAADRGYGFRVRATETDRGLLENWHGVLNWWVLAPDAAAPDPGQLRAWQRFVADNIEFRLGVAIGAVVARAWADGAGDPLTVPSLDAWRDTTGLPWFGFWARELLRWGTLDPFVAFALSQGLAQTRDMAADRREEFEEWLVAEYDDLDSEDYIDPQLFLAWERSLPRPERAAASENRVGAELTGTTGERGLYRVVPVVANEIIHWIDAAGYVLAQSRWDVSPFRGRLHRQDFELHTDVRQPFVDRTFAG